MPNHEDGSGMMKKIGKAAAGLLVAGLAVVGKAVVDAILTKHNLKIDEQIGDKRDEIAELRSGFFGSVRNKGKIDGLKNEINDLENLRK